MKSLRIVLVAALAVIFSSAVLAADALVKHDYNLPGHGTFVLHFPAGWDAQLRQHPGDFPPTIVLTGFEGSPFVVMVTPRWAQSGAETDFGTPKNIHTLVERAAHAAESESVEGRISISSLGGGKGLGYYFTATDRDPKPGDFKYMTQGAVRVGELVCTFTILTNSDKPVLRNKALIMMTNAEQKSAR